MWAGYLMCGGKKYIYGKSLYLLPNVIVDPKVLQKVFLEKTQAIDAEPY